MRQLIKSEVPPKALKEMEKEGLVFRLGEWYLRRYDHDKSYRAIRITAIKSTKYGLRIHYLIQSDWECTEWIEEEHAYDSLNQYYTFTKLENGIDDFNKYRKESLAVLSGEISTDSYMDNTMKADVNEESALVHKGSKQMLIAMQQGLEEKKNHAEMIKKFVSYEMEKRRRELEKIKENLGLVLEDFYKKIEKIQRVITAIELYLGIGEELHQIEFGRPAPASDPICFRQQLLYMDEEIGHWKDGGLDYSNIDWFDEWLLKRGNYKSLAPESKCIVAFRPRRWAKEYGEGYESAIKNDANLNNSYFLIRNGENLYRIWTPNIVVHQRLFPLKKELQKLLDELRETEKESGRDSHSFEQGESKAEKVIHYYKKNAMLMQGLVDRTEVFHPLIDQISIFKMDQYPDAFNFIYDDEATLPSGKLPFSKWRKQINSKITRGSRILITGVYNHLYYDSRHTYAERWARWNRMGYDMAKQGVYEVSSKEVEVTADVPHYAIEDLEAEGRLVKKGTKLVERFCPGYERYESNDFNLVDKPKRKIHTFQPDDGNPNIYIEAYKCTYKEAYLYIMYNPGGPIYGWTYYSSERKNRVSFRIYPDDYFILNYDQINLDDIDFYLTSRVDRPNYLDMMPVLEKIQKELLEEQEKEKLFVRFVADRNENKFPYKGRKFIEDMVRESIAWWKFKNKWKRPVVKDDTLALRMIEKRILSNNYRTFKKWE